MAKINRFYLLIAALVMAKTTTAAAIDCNDPILTAAQDSVSDWTYDGFTYQRVLEEEARTGYNGWFTSAVCNMWDNSAYTNPEDIGPMSTCWPSEINYDTDGNLYWALCHGNVECEYVLNGYRDCTTSGSSGGGTQYIPKCSVGSFWNLWGNPYTEAGTCSACPSFNYAPGKYWGVNTSDSGRNDNGPSAASGGNISSCYVPSNISFKDNAGTFVYISDCHY